MPKIRGIIEYGRDFIKTPMRNQLGKMIWKISQNLYHRRGMELPKLPLKKKSKFFVYFSPKSKSYYLDPKEWEKRNEENKWNKIEWKLIKKQKGICPFCKVKLDHNQPNHIHHLKAVKDGGDNSLGNLQLIHQECHNQLHYQQIEKPKAFEEIKTMLEIRRVEKEAKTKYQEQIRIKDQQKKLAKLETMRMDSIEVSFRKWLQVKKNQGLARKLKKIGYDYNGLLKGTDEEVYPILAMIGITPAILQGNPTLTMLEKIEQETTEKSRQYIKGLVNETQTTLEEEL